MKLLLPLKYYDDAGKVKPPSAWYWCALYLCRSVLVLIGALSSREYGSELLSIFYSESRYLYLNLGIALPTLFALIIVGFREKAWFNDRPWLFGFVRPLMIVSVLGDFIFHVYFANLSHWQFSWLIAITFILDLLCLYFLLKDRHLLLMVKDWKINPNPKCKKQSVK